MNILHKVHDGSFLSQAASVAPALGSTLMVGAVGFVAFALANDGLTQFLNMQDVSAAVVIAPLLTASALGISAYGHVRKSRALTLFGHGLNYTFACVALVVGSLGSSYTAHQAASEVRTARTVAEELTVQINDPAGLAAWARAQPNVAPEQSKFESLVAAKRTSKGALIWEVTDECIRPSVHVRDCSILNAQHDKLQGLINSTVALRKDTLRQQLSDTRSEAPKVMLESSTALMMEVQRVVDDGLIGRLLLLLGLVTATIIEALLFVVLYIASTQRGHLEVQEAEEVAAPSVAKTIDQAWLMSKGFNGEWALKALTLLGTYQAGLPVKLLPSFKLLKTSREKLIGNVLEPLEALGFLDAAEDSSGVKTYTWTTTPLEDLT